MITCLTLETFQMINVAYGEVGYFRNETPCLANIPLALMTISNAGICLLHDEQNPVVPNILQGRERPLPRVISKEAPHSFLINLGHTKP